VAPSTPAALWGTRLAATSGIKERGRFSIVTLDRWAAATTHSSRLLQEDTQQNFVRLVTPLIGVPPGHLSRHSLSFLEGFQPVLHPIVSCGNDLVAIFKFQRQFKRAGRQAGA
jgi:hypothetical protein